MKRILLLLAAALLAACGWQGTGTVVQKQYHPAWVQRQIQCHTVNKAAVCVPNNVYWPQSWKLKVRDSKDNKTHWVEVGEQEYNDHSVGSPFANGGSA